VVSIPISQGRPSLALPSRKDIFLMLSSPVLEL
jgi:hypothetical protein